MFESDGYILIYEKNRNRIVITLPQTEQTMQNTTSPISNRKVDIPGNDMINLLLIIKSMFEEGEI